MLREAVKSAYLYLWKKPPQPSRSLEQHLVNSIAKLEDIVRGVTIAGSFADPADAGLYFDLDDAWDFNFSIRKLYELTGPFEALLSVVELGLFISDKHYDDLIPGDGDDQFAAAENWVHGALIGAMLFAAGCDVFKHYIWPKLHEKNYVRAPYPFTRNGLWDNLYQGLGRIEGVIGAATLYFYGAEDQGWTDWKDAWSWSTALFVTTVAALDMGVMKSIAKVRASSNLPQNIQESVENLLGTDCYHGTDSQCLADWMSNDDLVGAHKSSIETGIPLASENCLPCCPDTAGNVKKPETYHDAERLLASLKRLQKNIEEKAAEAAATRGATKSCFGKSF